MVSFDIKTSELDEYLGRFSKPEAFMDLVNSCVQEVYNEAIHFVHVDTGELLMSIDKIPVTYKGSGYEGGVIATSEHGKWEELRGGDHAFMTLATQSLETLFPYLLEEWWNDKFER